MGLRANLRLLGGAAALCVALAACGDKSANDHLAAAKGFLDKNDRKAAVIELKNALQKNADLAEARFLLGRQLLREGNAATAQVELRKALEGKYAEDQVVPELARAMLVNGQAEKLVDEFGARKFGKPAADASLQTTLAFANGGLGRQAAAEAALEAALAADPKYGPALLIRARQAAAAGDMERAMATADDVLAREPGNAEAWKLKGDIFNYGMRRRDEALAAYRKAAELDKGYLPAQLAIANLLLAEGKLEDTGKQLEALKKLAPKNLQVNFVEARLAYQNKDYVHARDLTQQVLQAVPNDPRALQLAGAIELQSGRPRQAEEYLTVAVRIAPELALARRLLIAAYLRGGQPAKALAALNDAAEGKGGLDPSLYTLAGEVHLHNGDTRRAEEYFAKALKLDPENARTRTALAVTQLAGGQVTDALEELQEISASDTGVSADLALVSAHLRRKEYDKALADIDKLEAKQPGKPVAANLRGRVLLAKGDRDAARKSFEQALSIDASFFPAAASLAAMDVEDKKPDDARKRFEAIVVKNPKNSQARLALAQLAATSGASKDDVRALLDKAVAANPSDVAPRIVLIDYHARNGDAKQALAVAQSAVAAVPSSPELLVALGRLQLGSGDANQAASTFGKLVTLQPTSAQALVFLAQAQAANKDPSAAEQSLRKALEIRPDSLDAQRALVALALERNRPADALATARSVQKSEPKSAAGFMLEGDVERAQKHWDAAAAAYRAALARDGGTDVAIRLHDALVAAGKAAEASQFAAGWAKGHPQDLQFVIYLSEQAIARRDYAGAEPLLRSALAMQPDNAMVLNNLAWVGGQLKRSDALGLAEKADRLAPNQPPIMDTLAALLADSKDYGRAVDMQKRALALQPDNAGMRLNLAKIYVKAGNKELAKVELQRLAKLGDKFPAQAEVASLLQTL